MFKPHLILLTTALLPGVTGVRSAAAAPREPEAHARTVSVSRSTEAACRKAVQEFYNWYVPRMMREVRVSARDQALMTRPRNFSPELRRRLAEDGAAAAKSPDEIVGLDFDPFVNSQDPASRYVAKRVYRVGNGYRVEVHGVIDGKANAKPDVIPELAQSRGRWTFVNFHYPAEGAEPKTDLLNVLRVLRNSRGTPARPTRHR